MVKRKANHVINGMNDAKSQGKGAGYIENDQLVLTEEERQNNKKEKQTNSRNTLKGGFNMTNKNTSKDMHKNAPKGHNPGQPEPLSGSKK